METTYFIRKSLDNQHKNKIDAMLHEAFQKYNHHTISESDIELFDNEHEFVVNKYQMAGGRAVVPHFFRHKHSANGYILITLSETLTYILEPIKGHVNNEPLL
jgi:hypothetical protein